MSQLQIQLSTRIALDTFRELDQYSQETGKSKAAITNAALLEYMKNHPPTKPNHIPDTGKKVKPTKGRG